MMGKTEKKRGGGGTSGKKNSAVSAAAAKRSRVARARREETAARARKKAGEVSRSVKEKSRGHDGDAVRGTLREYARKVRWFRGKNADEETAKAPQRGAKKPPGGKGGSPAEPSLEGVGKVGAAIKKAVPEKAMKAPRREAKKPPGGKGGSGQAAPRLECEENAAVRVRPGKASPLRTAALLAVLLLSLAALLWTYTATGVLNIKNVEVRGNHRLDTAYLRALSGITADTHLLKMDVKGAEKALRSEPYVARVSVSRRFPNTVTLDIEEREPQGLISQNGLFYLVDREGIVLESFGEKPPGIMEIKGIEVPLLFPGQKIGGGDFATISELVSSMPASLKEITTTVGYRGGDGFYVVSKGTRVIYGEALDLRRKSFIALMALSSLVDRYRAVEYIDLSFPDHPVMKPV